MRELLQRGVNEIAKASKQQQDDSNPGSLDWEADILTATVPHPTHEGRSESGELQLAVREEMSGEQWRI